jgi:hypothetical protein
MGSVIPQAAVRQLVEQCASRFNTTVVDIMGPSRFHEHVKARVSLMCRLRRQFPDASLITLGKAVNKHHTTVLHHLRKAERQQHDARNKDRSGHEPGGLAVPPALEAGQGRQKGRQDAQHMPLLLGVKGQASGGLLHDQGG